MFRPGIYHRQDTSAKRHSSSCPLLPLPNRPPLLSTPCRAGGALSSLFSERNLPASEDVGKESSDVSPNLPTHIVAK
jgi:hypothetical protein